MSFILDVFEVSAREAAFLKQRLLRTFGAMIVVLLLCKLFAFTSATMSLLLLFAMLSVFVSDNAN